VQLNKLTALIHLITFWWGRKTHRGIGEGYRHDTEEAIVIGGRKEEWSRERLQEVVMVGKRKFGGISRSCFISSRKMFVGVR
jgi:hypothetical protein